MIECMDEPKLKSLMRSVRDNPGGPVALLAVSEIVDEVRRLRDALELSEAMRVKVEADLREALEQHAADAELYGEAVRIDPQHIKRLDS